MRNQSIQSKSCHTVALYHFLRVVFLADGDGPFFTVTGDVHAEDSRHVALVGHLEPVHQLLREPVKQILAGAEEQNIAHVERQHDEASLILVGVNVRIRLERAGRAPRPYCRTNSSGSAGDHTSHS